ncbi:MAG: flagellar biosynthesis anti-sigma factor FlgM [Blastomonas sp.]
MNPISSYSSQPVGLGRQAPSGDKSVGAASSVGRAGSSGPAVQSSIADIAAQGAPIDESRVAELRNALANGNYVIDTEKLAAKMLELDLGIS